MVTSLKCFFSDYNYFEPHRRTFIEYQRCYFWRRSNDCRSNDRRGNDRRSNDRRNYDCRNNDCRSNDCRRNEKTPSAPVTALCSEGSMFRRFYVQKIFVQKVLCSEGSIFRRSYVQKVLCSEKNVKKVLYSEGSMLRRSYIQIYSEGPIFRKFFVLCRNKPTSFSSR